MEKPRNAPEPVRLGIIGPGEHGKRAHLDYLAEMSDVEIVALVDIDSDRIKSTNEELGMDAEGYLDWKQMLEESSVEAILVMTPDRFHAEQLIGAVATGRHVFCEKPLATSPTEYNDLYGWLQRAEEGDLVVSTCHPRRFDPPFLAVKEWLDNRVGMAEAFGLEDPGEVVGFDFSFQYHKPSKVGLHHSLMDDHLNHEVDALNFLFGTRALRHATKHVDTETEFHVSGVRTDDVTFSFRGSRKLDERIYPERMRVFFERGELSVDMFHGSADLLSESQYGRVEAERLKTNYLTRFSAINRHFIEAVLGREPSYIPADDMLLNTRAALELRDQEHVTGIEAGPMRA